MKKSKWKHSNFPGIGYEGGYERKGDVRFFVVRWTQSATRKLLGKTKFMFQSHEDAKAMGWKKVSK